MLDRFFKLALPSFSCALNEYAYEFLIICMDRLCNLGLFETYGMYYSAF